MREQRVLHVITGLGTGGAEMMLFKLLAATDRTQFKPSVMVLMDTGALGERIERLRIPVYTLGLSQGRPTLSALRDIVKLMKQLQPNMIQSWMYHGNIASSVAGCLMRECIPILWNIRHTPYDLRSYKKTTSWLIRIGAWLSRHPEHIVFNSYTSAQRHKELGYSSQRQVVIPNGFDTQLFAPSLSARFTLRRLLSLPHHTLLIGMVARYHPQKDHTTFVRAATQLTRQNPDVHFVLVGPGIEAANDRLSRLIRESDLVRNIHLLGERSDVSEITSGLDIATLSSAWGEACPNVLGEAMACGVPCAVTDIGDSAKIVEKTGIVVPPRNPDALADAWDRLIELGSEGRAQLGRAARQRIVTHFSLPEIVRRYEDLYLGVLAPDERVLVNGSSKCALPTSRP